MKYQTYIYGRTLKIDFREICSPAGGMSPKTVSLVKELINTDVASNGDINRVRYLFVRDCGKVLFGIGFNHRQHLNRELQTDLSGRRGLRSFVGIVIEDCDFASLQAIPTDSDFYIKLYLRYISSVWDLEDRPKNRRVITSEISEQVPMGDWCKLDGNITFNTEENCCRFFSQTEESQVLSSIKGCPSAVAVGLNVEGHVLTAFRRFRVNIPNALCLDTQTSHDHEFVTKSNDVLNDKDSMTIDWGEEDGTPKKVTRPKFIAMGVLSALVLLAILLLIIKCSQKVPTNFNPSTSGDSTNVVKPLLK